MPIVGGLDIHRKQITFDYLDTETGQVQRGQISPADREHLRAWLARFAGRDDAEVSFPVGPSTRSMKAQDYLINVAIVHFYFHCTTAYALLRHNGLNIGKRDFFGPVR